MARGFESKAVADQQQEPPEPEDGPSGPRVDAVVVAKRQSLLLARCDVVRRLSLAKAEPHREILRRALEALDVQISAFEAPSGEI